MHAAPGVSNPRNDLGGYVKMADEAKVLEAIEIARSTGKIKKGSNEATKSLERGDAKLVAFAGDVSPKEIVMHLPLLAKEKGVLCVEIPQKDSLGAAVGLSVGCAAVAVVNEGDAKALIKELNESSKSEKE
jgi:large subunit ribosomal protein L7Ae